ncbi:MAG TPA: selenocysteine-specific translation elongation factor [Spirochaetota bacterium]|nr:selenocysteine-specific translation elongation factor [Spirochaetota bacterium]HOD15970.1 selenocysteine-specific translation elongation factor [Spirochaetota bacterium]HPG51099.1 selenocysteine-specific translation elongation factor [Spirochaetota bacterium]HPN11000.1 selenocysteine-specific translation elongation factor [Spirochaetota bacterium]
MNVIGTAGHIDHGKTSLIMALTGIDCDRLPEEKARQMTIDIGFAHLELPGFGTVGFIDVPGHERFIRNMVAGAWGIDLGLLLVAVDDGWMPQTEDHFRVLQLLGVERIVIALNKIDIAGEDMVALVEADVRQRLAGTPYRDADIVRVSSKTCAGIDSLKTALAGNLKKLAEAHNADKPYLYIDRIFGSKGHGTVVTGTLRNGLLRENDPVRIEPGGIETRIKRIESHHSTLAEGSPSQRTALNLSGVSADALKRGHILFRTGFFTRSREVLVRIRLLEGRRELKNNSGIEVLIGTAAVRGKMIFLAGDTAAAGVFPARIKFEEPWFCYPGQPFVLTSPGGFRIIGGGMVLLPGYDGRKHRARAEQGLARLSAYSFEERLSFIVLVLRWIRRGDIHGMLPESRAFIDESLDSLLKRNAVRQLGDYIMDSKSHDEAVTAVLDAVKKHVGINVKELSDATGTDPEICRLIIASLAAEKRVTEKEGRFFEGSGSPSVTLSPGKEKLLETARANGGAGLEMERLAGESVKRDARELIKLGMLVSLDGNILFHSDVYNKMKDTIVALFDTRAKLTVPEAKEAVGLSRKYILPLLNRIERDGLIKRLGDFRIKA